MPKRFGDWREVDQQSAQVVNPQTQQLLDKLYSQILSRTYVDSSGYRVMLSLAYGDDQRGGLAAHKPEVCYPAQGFALLSSGDSTIQTAYGEIAARRLSTKMGNRNEPLTYWFNVGDTTIRNKLEQRIVEMRLGLSGHIPDGLLFRVSSIDERPDRAYRMQEVFVKDLLEAVGRRTGRVWQACIQRPAEAGSVSMRFLTNRRGDRPQASASRSAAASFAESSGASPASGHAIASCSSSQRIERSAAGA